VRAGVRVPKQSEVLGARRRGPYRRRDGMSRGKVQAGGGVVGGPNPQAEAWGNGYFLRRDYSPVRREEE
jgi:hypothetical protein